MCDYLKEYITVQNRVNGQISPTVTRFAEWMRVP
jgi:hypothetical protein